MTTRLVFISIALSAVLSLGGGCRDTSLRTQLPEDTLRMVLKEFYMIEQCFIIIEPNPEARDSMSQLYYRRTLRQHSIDPEVFLADYNALQRHPEIFAAISKDILEEVNLELTLLRERLRERNQLEAAERLAEPSAQQQRARERRARQQRQKPSQPNPPDETPKAGANP
jgi:hypothetical protein